MLTIETFDPYRKFNLERANIFKELNWYTELMAFYVGTSWFAYNMGKSALVAVLNNMCRYAFWNIE